MDCSFVLEVQRAILCANGTKAKGSPLSRNPRDPLMCGPGANTVARRDIPEGGEENMGVLETLLEQRNGEIDPDIIAELDTLIENICEA